MSLITKHSDGNTFFKLRFYSEPCSVRYTFEKYSFSYMFTLRLSFCLAFKCIFYLQLLRGLVTCIRFTSFLAGCRNLNFQGCYLSIVVLEVAFALVIDEYINWQLFSIILLRVISQSLSASRLSFNISLLLQINYYKLLNQLSLIYCNFSHYNN